MKNVYNSGTANESSEINAEFANSGVSHVFDDTQSFDSSETDISRNNRTASTLNEHEATNRDTCFEFVDNKDGLSVFYTNADNTNKIDELKKRRHLKPFHALVVAEVYPKTEKSF